MTVYRVIQRQATRSLHCHLKLASTIIKLNWIVYKNEIINHIPLLTAENPQKVYQNARRIYKQALKQMDEYGPAVNELREFYRKVVLEPV